MFVFLEDIINVYILSIATVFLAVFIAVYCANNFISAEKEKHPNNPNTINDKNKAAESDSDDELSEGLVTKLKSARLKELEGLLSDDQLEEEKRVEREQLAAIFELLKRQEAELNMKEIDESELTAQMGLYR